MTHLTTPCLTKPTALGESLWVGTRQGTEVLVHLSSLALLNYTLPCSPHEASEQGTMSRNCPCLHTLAFTTTNARISQSHLLPVHTMLGFHLSDLLELVLPAMHNVSFASGWHGSGGGTKKAASGFIATETAQTTVAKEGGDHRCEWHLNTRRTVLTVDT